MGDGDYSLYPWPFFSYLNFTKSHLRSMIIQVSSRLDDVDSLFVYDGFSAGGDNAPGGAASLPGRTGVKCLNFSKPQKRLFYSSVFAQDSSKNKKHVCLVKDNKLSFPALHAFHFCRKMDVHKQQHFLRFWKFLRSSSQAPQGRDSSPAP